MRHEEENHWHPSDNWRHENRRREHPHHREEKQLNDFGSRWGEPDPRFNPRHQEWQPHEDERRGEYRNPQKDWRPFEQQLEEQRKRSEQNHWERGDREPTWRQQDRHFSSDNQHANDRWQNGNTDPQPDQSRHYEDEMEHRKRRFRDHRED